MGDPPPPSLSIQSDEEYGKMVDPSFSPMLKGKFSLEWSDGQLKFYPDTRSLAKKNDVWDKSVSYNLNVEAELARNNAGVSNNATVPRKHAEHSRMKLESLLEWIVNEKGVAGSKFISPPLPDFVCPIGVLDDIMRKKQWSILATKFQGTIYLKKEEGERGRTIKNGNTSAPWGLKFEQYMTMGSDPNDPCDQNKAYYCVVRSELGSSELGTSERASSERASSEGASSKPVSHTLLYRAEVDVVDYTKIDQAGSKPDAHGNLPHDLEHIVELKTEENPIGNLPTFINTDWWSKAFLTGVPRITCGFRDKAGVVKTVKTYEVVKLPESFKPKIMKIILNEILGYMKGCIVKDDPKVVYKLARDSHLVSCRRLGRKTPFLTEAYVSKMRS